VIYAAVLLLESVQQFHPTLQLKVAPRDAIAKPPVIEATAAAAATAATLFEQTAVGNSNN